MYPANVTPEKIVRDTEKHIIQVPEQNSELQAILSQTTQPVVDTNVCLLRDSPFRILRVSVINRRLSV